jgi:FkbM family methyltransferase
VQGPRAFLRTAVPVDYRNRIFRAAFPFGKRVTIGNARVRLHSDFRRFGGYEPLAATVLMSAIQEGDIAVDVGANVGLHALAIASVIGDGGVVFAIEPDFRAGRHLRRHIRMSRYGSRIHHLEVAAAETNGVIPFASHERNYHSSAHDLRVRPGTTHQAIPTMRLDALFERIDVLKIDVEGFEGNVLRGADRLLADRERRPRLILVEVHGDVLEDRGESWSEIRAMVDGYDWAPLEGTQPSQWVGRLRSDS